MDLLLWESFPREYNVAVTQSVLEFDPDPLSHQAHPHTKLSIASLDKVSTNPILFTQVPNLEAVSSKLLSFVDASSSIPHAASVKQVLGQEFVTYLKGRFAPNAKAKQPSPTPQLLTKWTEASKTLLSVLAPAQLFPLTDMWRLALLDEGINSWCAVSAGTSSDPVQAILVKALTALSSQEAPATTRPYILTTLRLLSNAFSSDQLARVLLSAKRTAVTALLVSSLLHADASVRTAAASLAFNVASFLQNGRLEAVRARYGPFAGSDDEGEWEVELVSAILEGIANETQSEDIGAYVQLSSSYSHSAYFYNASCSSSSDSILGVPPALLSGV